MSVSGISSSNVFELIQAERNQSQNTQSQTSQASSLQQVEDAFTQLGNCRTIYNRET
jgi:hypothetical protein